MAPGVGVRRVMVEETLKQQAVAAVERLWEQGCPVAGPAGRERMVEVGLRRWRSFQRRNRRRSWARGDRIEDLAKGLRDAVEPEPRLAGPILADYRCVAEAIAAVVDPGTDSPTPADEEPRGRKHG